MKAVRSPPCAQYVFCVRARRLREAIGRHVRRGRTCRYGGFASGGAAAAWRDMPPVQAPPAIAQRIFPEIREKMRGNPPFADCPPPLGFAFFSGARKPAGFSRRGAQVGENALQAFSERAAAFRLRAFLSRIRIGASGTGQVGGFCARFLGRFPRNGERTGKIIREV